MEGGGPTKRHSTMEPAPPVLYLELVKKIAVAKNKSFGKMYDEDLQVAEGERGHEHW